MSCIRYQSDLIEWARNRECADYEWLAEHVRVCADCAEFLEEQSSLTKTMAAVALQAESLAVPFAIERTVMGEFDRVRRTQIARRIVIAGALAASVIAGVVTLKQRPTAPPMVAAVPMAGIPAVSPPAAPQVKPAKTPAVTITKRTRQRPGSTAAKKVAPPAVEPEAPFVAIPYTLPLAQDERATVVRMAVPAPALGAVGLPIAVNEPDAVAQADVLVDQSGRARAIRILSISDRRP